MQCAALRRVERDHVVALLQRHDARPDIDHDARALVAEDHREEALGIAAGARELVGVADARRLDLDQHLAELRPFEIDGLDLEFLAGLVADRSLGLHAPSPVAAQSLEQGREGASGRAGRASASRSALPHRATSPARRRRY